MTDTATQTDQPPAPIDVFRRQAAAMEVEMSRALPPHITVERFMRVVQTAVQTSMASNFTNLLECDRRSLWQAAMRAAQDGLVPDGREGAILKYGNDAQWVPMVAGIRKKARNSGEISTWDAHCVHKNDHFVMRLGDSPSIDHTYDLGKPRGELIGAYSVAVLKDGSKSYEVMSIEEIRALRDRSQAWKAFKANKIRSTPWSTDEAEMARKTVAKRHAKQLPSSADLDDLIRRDDHLYQEGSDDKPSNATAISARPSGAAALDQFAARVEPAPAEPSEPAEPEPDGVTVPDAMALGGQARHDGKRKLVPPDVAQLGDAYADAWRAGWDDADAEMAKEAK